MLLVANNEYRSYNIKFNVEDDADLIAFLETRSKTAIFKESLRLYIKNQYGGFPQQQNYSQQPVNNAGLDLVLQQLVGLMNANNSLNSTAPSTVASSPKQELVQTKPVAKQEDTQNEDTQDEDTIDSLREKLRILEQHKAAEATQVNDEKTFTTKKQETEQPPVVKKPNVEQTKSNAPTLRHSSNTVDSNAPKFKFSSPQNVEESKSNVDASSVLDTIRSKINPQ